MNRKARKFLKDKGIEVYGKPLGRPPKKSPLTSSQKYRRKKKAAQHNHVEGKFGQGKRGYGLNNVKARLKDTSESWVNAIFFVMNLTKLLQVAEKANVFFGLFLKMRGKLQISYRNYFLNSKNRRLEQIYLCVA